MARDAEAKKLTPWADSGDRQDPEEAGLDRAAGWTVAYEQAGSGNYPERLVFNQLLRELSGLFQEALGAGVYAVERRRRLSACGICRRLRWVSSRVSKIFRTCDRRRRRPGR